MTTTPATAPARSRRASWRRIGAALAATTATIALAAGCSSASGAGAHATGDASQAADSLEAIKAKGKITVGVFRDLPPFGSVDASGAYTGYDVYFAEQIGKDLGVDVDYVGLDAQGRVPALTSGKVDLVLANFTVTDERKQQVDFALPYMQVYMGVVSPTSAPITDVSQLEGKELIVAQGTTQQTYFTQHYPDVKLNVFTTETDAFAALKDGRSPALSQDTTNVLAWALQNPGFTVGIEKLGDPQAIAPAVRKGNTSLLDWLNEEITTTLPDDFFLQDYEATLAPVYGDAADPATIVVERGKIG
ncbi:transporter substrate-binding domain-containing protein [Xylanimonas allomyrinae]|uniref:Transporter substrate-binding domain-containing protein n=1 Tax=Xylanimonas allomyrinae TaxID=2509459 RepID=A0A4P6EL69_9MICO|nr:transporter substrate-binding domain-containing protein [Xylanimonas allomyrinae]QAY63105.1 transporter substrate-binding domain-containing protein [Xylanimonas allomyrinae]